VEKIDFFQLERPIQERFVEATRGAAAPAPLALAPLGHDRRFLTWLLTGVVALIAAVLLLRWGFGDLAHRYALVPGLFGVAYGALFALGALGFLGAAARYRGARAVPYRPALYLFPVGVIDARAPQFSVARVSEQSQVSVDVERRCLRVVIEGHVFQFPTTDLALAEQAARAIEQVRERLAETGPDSTTREQALIDPLVDNGFKNPFAPTDAMRKQSPLWVKLWVPIALALGAALGFAALHTRNTLSEARLYAAARGADSVEAYRAYLARGGSNGDVTSLLLPRAELRRAQQQGTVSAIEAFASTHPHTAIQGEVDTALHQALMQELASAQAVGTLNALRDFATRYAQYPFLAADLERAVNARIDAALQKLRPQLATNQTKLLPFFDRLLHYAAKHGPDLEVRFQRKPTETLEKAEKALRQNAYFTGEKALPGQYFDAAHDAPREAQVIANLVEVLTQKLPSDLVRPRAATTLTDTEDPKLQVPTLLIAYHNEMSGAFMSRKPRFALSGVGLLSRVSFEIPGDAAPLTFKVTLWRAPDVKNVDPDATPAIMYETMANEAFKRFTKQYLATLFASQ